MDEQAAGGTASWNEKNRDCRVNSEHESTDMTSGYVGKFCDEVKVE